MNLSKISCLEYFSHGGNNDNGRFFWHTETPPPPPAVSSYSSRKHRLSDTGRISSSCSSSIRFYPIYRVI